MDLTVERVLTLDTQIEFAMEQTKAIGRATAAPVQVVNQTSRCDVRVKRGHAASNPASLHPGKKKTCYRCGSDSHLVNVTNCPAATAIYKHVIKTGHFYKVCRSSLLHVKYKKSNYQKLQFYTLNMQQVQPIKYLVL